MWALYTNRQVYSQCILCNDYIQYDDIPLKDNYCVGVCPWCDKTFLYQSFPFKLAGMFGPYITECAFLAIGVAKELGVYRDIRKIDAEEYMKANRKYPDYKFIGWCLNRMNIDCDYKNETMKPYVDIKLII